MWWSCLFKAFTRLLNLCMTKHLFIAVHHLDKLTRLVPWFKAWYAGLCLIFLWHTLLLLHSFKALSAKQINNCRHCSSRRCGLVCIHLLVCVSWSVVQALRDNTIFCFKYNWHNYCEQSAWLALAVYYLRQLAGGHMLNSQWPNFL